MPSGQSRKKKRYPYLDVTKKYNKAICDDLGLTVPDGYEEIEG